jgi:hypothetical protein
MIFIFSRASISRLPSSLSLSQLRARFSFAVLVLSSFLRETRERYFIVGSERFEFCVLCILFKATSRAEWRAYRFFRGGCCDLRVWSLLNSFIFARPLAEREGIDSFSSPLFGPTVVLFTPFCLLVCLVFLALLGDKKGRNEDAPQPKALLCSTREKKVGKREREREGERPIYIYESERRSGVFGAPRAHPRRRRRRRSRREQSTKCLLRMEKEAFEKDK